MPYSRLNLVADVGLAAQEPVGMALSGQLATVQDSCWIPHLQVIQETVEPIASLHMPSVQCMFSLGCHNI